MNKHFWRATVRIEIQTSEGVAGVGATVDGRWAGGTSGSASCVTGPDGACGVSDRVPINSGTVTFTVTGVTHPIFTYDPAANSDPDGDSDGTSIAVSYQ